MSTFKILGSLMTLTCIALLASGCVGLEEHNRVKFALRKCQAKNEELTGWLEDEHRQAMRARAPDRATDGWRRVVEYVDDGVKKRGKSLVYDAEEPSFAAPVARRPGSSSQRPETGTSL